MIRLISHKAAHRDEATRFVKTLTMIGADSLR